VTNFKWTGPEVQSRVTKALRDKGLAGRGRPPRATTCGDAIRLLSLSGFKPGEIAKVLEVSPQFVSQQRRALKGGMVPAVARPVVEIPAVDDTPRAKGGKVSIDLDTAIAQLETVMAKQGCAAHAQGLVTADDVNQVRQRCRFLDIWVSETPTQWSEAVWAMIADQVERKSEGHAAR
jgi:hypothetical protein